MPGFTHRVRQELAADEPVRACDRRALLAGLFGTGGSLHLTGGGDDPLRLELTTIVGAVARLAFRVLQRVGEDIGHPVAPELEVHPAAGIHHDTRYVVVVRRGAREVARGAGLLDAEGRPLRDVPAILHRRACDRRAFARGALLGGGSFSAPGRDPHAEISAPTEALARSIATDTGWLAGHPAGVGASGSGWRAVLKSGDAIGALLSSLGASRAFLEWDDARLRRQLRAEANRLANADAANLRRAIDAAASQVRAVERAVHEVGWDGLDEDLRQVALARLANPEASLSEIGDLCDPPIGKSAAHRRLARLEALGSEGTGGA